MKKITLLLSVAVLAGLSLMAGVISSSGKVVQSAKAIAAPLSTESIRSTAEPTIGSMIAVKEDAAKLGITIAIRAIGCSGGEKLNVEKSTAAGAILVSSTFGGDKVKVLMKDARLILDSAVVETKTAGMIMAKGATYGIAMTNRAGDVAGMVSKIGDSRDTLVVASSSKSTPLLTVRDAV